MYNLHYILKDHLGSWTTIADAEGNVEQELSFDAWGTLRDPETWTGTSTEAPMFDRGFTGHEHLRFFDLINMNGRMYDPVMSTFLSVDAYVQDPTSAQGFNRYAYCSHNPLRYVDPTGWQQQNPSSNPNFNTNHNNSRSVQGDDPLEGWGSVSGYTFATSSGMCGNTLVTFYSEGNEIGCGYMLNDAIVEAKWSDSDYAKGIAYSHSGTPASQSGPYYQPAPNPGNGSSNGHGTGGNIGGGKNNSKSAIQHIISKTLYPISATGTAVSYGSQTLQVPKNADDFGKFLRSNKLAPKNLSGSTIGKQIGSEMNAAGKWLGWTGAVLTTGDVLMSGDISAGDIYNMGIAVACVIFASNPTGWIIGAVALGADYVSWRWTGQTISEHLDNNIKWKYKL